MFDMLKFSQALFQKVGDLAKEQDVPVDPIHVQGVARSLVRVAVHMLRAYGFNEGQAAAILADELGKNTSGGVIVVEKDDVKPLAPEEKKN